MQTVTRRIFGCHHANCGHSHPTSVTTHRQTDIRTPFHFLHTDERVICPVPRTLHMPPVSRAYVHLEDQPRLDSGSRPSHRSEPRLSATSPAGQGTHGDLMARSLDQAASSPYLHLTKSRLPFFCLFLVGVCVCIVSRCHSGKLISVGQRGWNPHVSSEVPPSGCISAAGSTLLGADLSKVSGYLVPRRDLALPWLFTDGCNQIRSPSTWMPGILWITILCCLVKPRSSRTMTFSHICRFVEKW